MSSIAIWDDLAKAGAAGAASTVTRRLFPASRLEVHLGLRRPGDEPLLILDLAEGTLPAPHDLPTTRAILPEIVDGPNGRVRLQLALGDRTLRPVFGSFVDDVTAKLHAASDDAGAVAILVDRHRQWRQLLTRGPRGLSEREEQGLWGELWVLTRVLVPWLGPDQVHSWTGPDGTTHDFQTGEADIEVKATRNGRPGSVRISRIDQLEPRGKPLALIALGVDASAAGTGVSVDELIGELRVQLDARGAAFLDDRLVAIGWLSSDDGHPSATRFTVGAVGIYHVDEDFPRLTEPSLPPGILGVSYDLDLSVCAKHRITDDRLKELLDA